MAAFPNFSGNKPCLPCKRCVHAGTMPWRKRWTRDWAMVKYCSERCRRTGRSVRELP